MQSKDIVIPSGTDVKDVDAIMANLQKLTRDKLTTTVGVNGAIHVFIDQFQKKGKYESGTQLIRDLITDEHVVKIRTGKSNFAEAKNKVNASNGVGTDSDITFDPQGKQDIRVFENSNSDKTKYETASGFVLLGHELIHAKDHFQGTLDRTESEHSYLDLKGIRLIETFPKSEFRAVGFPGFVGKDDISENNIRLEHGLKLRAAYEFFKGKTR
ncbi:M91 family zinc metallopeptidase [Chryseobacterium sp. H1D6B]|uniref:M91 family zinc metallopeptidase n=1 Tax=Chryseobacterium sp. H1D6B TaxID=2940588 RepID=UPI0032AEB06B